MRYADRPSARLLDERLSADMTPMQQICHYRQMNVAYVVAKSSRAKAVTSFYIWEYSDKDIVEDLIDHFPDTFREVSHNADFRIYSFSAAPCG
jgi:hypothetical protein